MGAQVKTAYATLVGDVVSSRYRVVGEVGRTDFGVLYLAEDMQQIGRSVAINVLIGDLPAEESERHRFEFETEALARRSDIDLTDFINAGRLPDGRPYWVLACTAVVPELIRPEDLKKAMTPTAAPSSDVGPRRIERYEYVPVWRRQTFLLLVYALPVLIAVIASVGVKVIGTEEPARTVRSFERHLDYTVWAQRYAETLAVGDRYAVDLPRAFAVDERLQLEFGTPEEGYLYVVHEITAQQQNGIPSYAIVFPGAGRNEQAAYLQSTRRAIVPAEGHLDFAQGEAADRLWMVWSSIPLDQFSGLARDGRIDATQITAIQQLLGRRSTAPVTSSVDEASKRVRVVSGADPWIHSISLSRQ